MNYSYALYILFLFLKGDPVAQLSFVSEQIPSVIPWRDENYIPKRPNIYPYGVFTNESYQINCTIRHRADIERPLNMYIQYFQCPINNCLSNLIHKPCLPQSDPNTINTTSIEKSDFETQLISTISHKLNNSNIGHQYLCCYEQDPLINIAKGITILSSKKTLNFYSKIKILSFKIIVICFTLNNQNLI